MRSTDIDYYRSNHEPTYVVTYESITTDLRSNYESITTDLRSNYESITTDHYVVTTSKCVVTHV